MRTRTLSADSFSDVLQWSIRQRKGREGQQEAGDLGNGVETPTALPYEHRAYGPVVIRRTVATAQRVNARVSLGSRAASCPCKPLFIEKTKSKHEVRVKEESWQTKKKAPLRDQLSVPSSSSSSSFSFFVYRSQFIK